MIVIRNRVFTKNLYRCVRRYYCQNYCGGSDTAGDQHSQGDQQSGSGPINPNMPRYDDRKYSPNLPAHDVCLPFEGLCNIPNGVFRRTDCEKIGPGAGKCCYYQNPEFYSFHNMTFFDMHLLLRPCRKPQIDTGRKPI